MRATRPLRTRALAALLTLLAGPPAARADGLTGDYVCSYGCRATDAAPRIEIAAGAARCWNELGGLFFGAFHSPDEIACFGKTGRVAADGRTIRWSDGVIWIRH